jgi:hypothetical protein
MPSVAGMRFSPHLSGPNMYAANFSDSQPWSFWAAVLTNKVIACDWGCWLGGSWFEHCPAWRRKDGLREACSPFLGFPKVLHSAVTVPSLPLPLHTYPLLYCLEGCLYHTLQLASRTSDLSVECAWCTSTPYFGACGYCRSAAYITTLHSFCSAAPLHWAAACSCLALLLTCRLPFEGGGTCLLLACLLPACSLLLHCPPGMVHTASGGRRMMALLVAVCLCTKHCCSFPHHLPPFGPSVPISLHTANLHLLTPAEVLATPCASYTCPYSAFSGKVGCLLPAL